MIGTNVSGDLSNPGTSGNPGILILESKQLNFTSFSLFTYARSTPDLTLFIRNGRMAGESAVSMAQFS